MAYDSSKLVDLATLAQTVTKIETEYHEAMEKAGISVRSIYEGTKTDPEEKDTSIITAFFEKTDAPVPTKGDVFIVSFVENDETIEESAYYYSGKSWLSLTGGSSGTITEDDIASSDDVTQMISDVFGGGTTAEAQ